MPNNLLRIIVELGSRAVMQVVRSILRFIKNNPELVKLVAELIRAFVPR